MRRVVLLLTTLAPMQVWAQSTPNWPMDYIVPPGEMASWWARKLDYAADGSVTVGGTLTLGTLASSATGLPVGRVWSNGGLLGVITAPAGLAGRFYQDQGAQITRLPDRLLIGAAADNQGLANRDAVPRDWLSTVMAGTSIGAYATHGAQGASITRDGTIGFLAASRTSDARASAAILGYTPASIGSAGWCINDDTVNPTATTCWAGYEEAWRMPGVNYQPTFGREIEGVNMGGAFFGYSTSYHVNNGGGVYGLQIGCGGGQTSGTSDCDAALTIVSNPNHFAGAGIVFAANAITGTDGSAGDTGFGPAIKMGRNQGLQWSTPETYQGEQGVLAGFILRSTVANAANGVHLEAQDGGILTTNNLGVPTLAIETVTGTISSHLALQPGVSVTTNGVTSSSASAIYARGANANIALYPGVGGELQITTTVAAPGGGTTTLAPAYGWQKINVNGTDMRIPLFSPSQAGG